MAIYQFFLMAIPKKGVVEKFSIVPSNIPIDFEQRTQDFLEKGEAFFEEEDAFERTVHDCWKTAQAPAKEIITAIDILLPRASWGNAEDCCNWKLETASIDHDASLELNPDIDIITDLRFRADLRNISDGFLEAMIVLAKQNDWLLVDETGKLIAPEMEEVTQLIIPSNASKFINNPIKFFEELEKPKK